MARREPGSRPLATARRERMVLGILEGLSVRDAYHAAGYVGKGEYTPYQVTKDKRFKDRLRWLRMRAAVPTIQKVSVNRAQVTEELQQVLRVAMEGSPVLAKDGSETGVMKPDLSAANRAIEIKAKVHGLMVDVQRDENLDDELDGKNPEELKSFVMGLLEALDPNLRKSVVAELEAQASEDATEVEGVVFQ